MRTTAFIKGHILGAVLAVIGVTVFVEPSLWLLLSILVMSGAVISSLACLLLPKLNAKGWQLWLTATLANPVFLYEALSWGPAGGRCATSTTGVIVIGDHCWFSAVGLVIAATTLPSPRIGLAFRWNEHRLDPDSTARQ
jgi:hypothetical protein